MSIPSPMILKEPEIYSEYEFSRSSLPGTFPLQEPDSSAFEPLPSASSNCRKLRLSIHLDSTVFIAGQSLHGRLVVETLAHNGALKLGDISVLLQGKKPIFNGAASEHVKHKNINNSRIFLSANIKFQGARSPTTLATLGKRDADGYATAIKGKTVFPFALTIPEDAPSSFDYGKIASLSYVFSLLSYIDMSSVELFTTST